MKPSGKGSMKVLGSSFSQAAPKAHKKGLRNLRHGRRLEHSPKCHRYANEIRCLQKDTALPPTSQDSSFIKIPLLKVLIWVRMQGRVRPGKHRHPGNNQLLLTEDAYPCTSGEEEVKPLQSGVLPHYRVEVCHPWKKGRTSPTPDPPQILSHAGGVF